MERRHRLAVLGAVCFALLVSTSTVWATTPDEELPDPFPGADESDGRWETTPRETPTPGVDPVSEPAAPAVWIRENPWSWEIGLTGWAGDHIRDLSGPDTSHAFRYGGTLRVGALYQTDVDKPSCRGSFTCIGSALATGLKSIAIGNQYGLDVRGRVWHARDTTWMGVAVEPLALLVWGEPGDGPFERIRTMTMVGSLLPEVGVLFEPDGDEALSLRFVFPVSVLVTRHFGLEFRFAESLVLPRRRPNSFSFSFGLGLLFR